MRCSLTIGLILVLMSGSDGLLKADDKPAPGSKGVQIDVLLVDFAAGAPAKVKDSEGPTLEQILDLEKQGKLNTVTRIRLASLENSVASVQFGETVGVATGRSTSPFGRAAAGERGGVGGSQVNMNYSMQNIGTLVSATPRVEPDGAVVLELKVDQSRLAETPPADSEKPDAAAFSPPRISMVQVHATLRVQPGKPVVTGGQRSTGKDGKETWIVVSAKVLDPK